ncbi:MAG: YqcC family protein [Chromatiales bacterium]|jgi:uncharacterized protein YqcC (DUF446 family)
MAERMAGPGDKAVDCERIIAALEDELRRIGLWEDQPPAPEALASTTPFCFDTLELHQWLEWVLIPRTRAVLQGGLPLPEKSAIQPLAEEVFKDLEVETARLEALIGEFDRLINEDL